MEQVILTAGQAMLLLSAVVSLLALLYFGLWLSAGIVRMVRRWGRLDAPTRVYRPGGGGGVRGSARKW